MPYLRNANSSSVSLRACSRSWLISRRVIQVGLGHPRRSKWNSHRVAHSVNSQSSRTTHSWQMNSKSCLRHAASAQSLHRQAESESLTCSLPRRRTHSARPALSEQRSLNPCSSALMSSSICSRRSTTRSRLTRQEPWQLVKASSRTSGSAANATLLLAFIDRSTMNTTKGARTRIIK